MADHLRHAEKACLAPSLNMHIHSTILHDSFNQLSGGGLGACRRSAGGGEVAPGQRACGGQATSNGGGRGPARPGPGPLGRRCGAPPPSHAWSHRRPRKSAWSDSASERPRLELAHLCSQVERAGTSLFGLVLVSTGCLPSFCVMIDVRRVVGSLKPLPVLLHYLDILFQGPNDA